MCSFVQKCQNEHVVLGERAIMRAAVKALAARSRNRKKASLLGGLSPSTASSNHKLLPVYFMEKVKADSLLK